ncbi:MAG: energy-coupling factor transporter ATPase [Clostridia bacterium]|nr:energy-coupling factor transporter ATPase [Clostridia bacterium]
MSAVISVKNLTHRYNEGLPHCHVAVDNVSFDIEKGDFIGLIGHTGSGKSTLVQHLNGLMKPSEGDVLIDGKSIWESKKSVRAAKFKVGLCFQYPEYQLFEETVEKDIAYGPKNMKLKEEEIRRRVAIAASFVGLKPEHLMKSPFELSGGEKRRAAIAGVMAMQPEVLILDEPTAGLDPKGRDTVLNMIENFRKSTGCTVILVSHSMEDVAKAASKVLVMNKGKVAMYDETEKVFARAEELSEMGLNVPQVSKVFSILRQKGLPVSDGIFTVDKAVEDIARLMKGGKAK